MSVAGAKIGTVTPADILAFEAEHPIRTPEKDERIIRELGITPIRYVVLLNRAAASADGIAAHPVMARRVRELAALRADRRMRRTAA